MKTLLKAVPAALLLALGTAPATAQQLSPPVIVIVDMDRIVNESAAGKAAATEIQGKISAAQGRATTLQGQLKTEEDAIRAGQANKSLAGPALEARIKAFSERQQQAQAELGRLEQDIGRSRQHVIKQITDGANPIITQVMRERGASIALAEGATLQHSATIDVTTDVVTRLNTSLPKVSTTPPAAPAAAPRR